MAHMLDGGGADGILYVKTDEAPLRLDVNFGEVAFTTPLWHSSDNSVVNITSTTADGLTALPDFGQPGQADVVVTAKRRDGSRLIARRTIVVKTFGTRPPEAVGVGKITWAENGI